MTHEVLTAYVPLGNVRTRYVVETVLRDGAGLPLDIVERPQADVRIALGPNDEGLHLAPADRSFSSSVLPLLRLGPNDVERIDLTSPQHDPLQVDALLSALFHVLAGTEEVEKPERDPHERFPASESSLFAAGFRDAPFVDLWADAIVRAVKARWPSIEIRRRSAQLHVSHDVDAPFRYRFQPASTLLKVIANDVLRGRWLQAAKAPLGWIRVKKGRIDQDPYNHFSWMMDEAEKIGARCTFYVIAGHSDDRMDGDYDLYHPVMLQLWQEILERGHRLGLHPSYNSFRSLSTLERERDRVIKIHSMLGRPATVPPVRMHYLRFDPAVTPALLSDAGFTDDSTLGFADQSGFRRGTCRAFRLWDHGRDQPLDLIEHPLLAMDATLLAKRYEHLDEAGVLKRIVLLAEWCHRFGGDLTLLWHNNYFEQGWHFSAYRKVLRILSEVAGHSK